MPKSETEIDLLDHMRLKPFYTIVQGANNSLGLGISSLRSSRQQEETPNIGINSGVLGIVTEHTHSTRFAELSILVVEVLSGGNLVNLCPFFASANLRGWEDA